jgi:hypothetical protein
MAAACSLNREVIGSTAIYRIAGSFEGSCAWELCGRIEREPLSALVLDFSQVGDFVDYGIAVLANALLSMPQRTVELRGLRQHQERLFRYFGVDAAPRSEEIELSPAIEAALHPVKLRRGAA